MAAGDNPVVGVHLVGEQEVEGLAVGADLQQVQVARAVGRDGEIDLVPNDLERVFGKPPVTKPTTRKRDPVHALLGTTGASSERGN